MQQKRGCEPLLIGRAVQTQRIDCNDTKIQRGQRDSVVMGERFQAQAQVRCGIFRGIKKHRPCGGHGEPVQARGAGSHRHGHLQCQPGLVALGMAPNDAHGLCRPQLINQPGRCGSGRRLQIAGTHDRKRCRRSWSAHNNASAQSRIAASARVASTRLDLPLAANSKHRVATTSMRRMMPPVAFAISSRPSSAKTSR